MTNPTHLDDGAYVHADDEGNVVLTANHHDPMLATDIVTLSQEAVKSLMHWLVANKLDP